MPNEEKKKDSERKEPSQGEEKRDLFKDSEFEVIRKRAQEDGTKKN